MKPEGLIAKAVELKQAAVTPAQRKRREEVDARNAAIQTAAIKPKDGVTFGKKEK